MTTEIKEREEKVYEWVKRYGILFAEGDLTFDELKGNMVKLFPQGMTSQIWDKIYEACDMRRTKPPLKRKKGDIILSKR